MPDPTEDIPANRPLGWSDRDFQFRALGVRVARTGGIGAVVELANQFDRPLQGMEMPIAMVTDIHPAPTDRTRTVQDVQFPLREIRILRPSVRHPANLRVGGDPSRGQTRQQLTSRTCVLLAFSR